MKPLVSVIVVNWNGGEIFKNCLFSLSKIDYPRWELIVVDNGSRDGSVEKLEKNKHSLLLRSKTNLGFAPANNQGFKESKGDYILLLNNDTKVERNFLTKLVERMEKDEKIGVIQPKIFMMDKPGYLDNAGSFFTRIGFLEHWGFGQKDSQEFSKEREIFSAKGACMLIKREVIEKVGLFDEDFISYFEESDFCWRVWLARYRVIFYPNARIYHKIGFTIRRLDVGNINFHYYKNRIASLIKNLGALNLLMILPIHIFISLMIVALFMIRGNFNNSLLILRAIQWNINKLPDTLRKRKLVQREKKVNDGDLFKNLSRPVNFLKFFDDFKRVEEDIKRKK